MNASELSEIERNVARQNFKFYDKNNAGFVERFELNMMLQQCGYFLSDDRILKIEAFLDEK